MESRVGFREALLSIIVDAGRPEASCVLQAPKQRKRLASQLLFETARQQDSGRTGWTPMTEELAGSQSTREGGSAGEMGKEGEKQGLEARKVHVQRAD